MNGDSPQPPLPGRPPDRFDPDAKLSGPGGERSEFGDILEHLITPVGMFGGTASSSPAVPRHALEWNDLVTQSLSDKARFTPGGWSVDASSKLTLALAVLGEILPAEDSRRAWLSRVEIEPLSRDDAEGGTTGEDATISISPAQLRDMVGLIVTLGHEIGHLARDGGKIKTLEEKLERELVAYKFQSQDLASLKEWYRKARLPEPLFREFTSSIERQILETAAVAGRYRCIRTVVGLYGFCVELERTLGRAGNPALTTAARHSAALLDFIRAHEDPGPSYRYDAATQLAGTIMEFCRSLHHQGYLTGEFMGECTRCVTLLNEQTHSARQAAAALMRGVP